MVLSRTRSPGLNTVLVMPLAPEERTKQRDKEQHPHPERKLDVHGNSRKRLRMF